MELLLFVCLFYLYLKQLSLVHIHIHIILFVQENCEQQSTQQKCYLVEIKSACENKILIDLAGDKAGNVTEL